MASVTTTCPGCDKKLRLSKRPADGRRIKCPACGDPFLPEFEEEGEGEDKATGIQERPPVKATGKSAARDRDDDDEDDAPAKWRRRDRDDDSDDRPAIKRKGNKKENANMTLVWGMVAGGAFLVLACGGLGIGAFVLLRGNRIEVAQVAAVDIQAPVKEVARPVPPPPAPANLAAFVAADANLLVGSNVKGVREANQLDTLIAQLQTIPGTGPMPAEFKEILRKCDQVLLSVNTNEIVKQMANQGPAMAPRPLGPKKGLKGRGVPNAPPAPVSAPKVAIAALMTNAGAMTKIKSLPNIGTADNLGGKYPVYRQRNFATGQTTLIAFPSDRIVVASPLTEQELTALLDRALQPEGAAPPMTQLTKMAGLVESAHFWAAYATDAQARQMMGMLPLMVPLPPNAPPAAQGALQAVAKINGAAIAVDSIAGGAWKFQLHVNCEDAGAAQALKDGGDALKSEVMAGPGAPPTIAQAFNSLTLQVQGTMASANVTMTAQTIADFAQLAPGAGGIPKQGPNAFNPNGAPPSGRPAPMQFHNILNLKAQASNDKVVQFQQGKQITVKAIYSAFNPKTNVDLYVFEGAPQQNKIAARDEKPANVQTRPTRMCTASFVAQATGQYTIRVMNRGPGSANTCNITIQEQ